MTKDGSGEVLHGFRICMMMSTWIFIQRSWLRDILGWCLLLHELFHVLQSRDMTFASQGSKHCDKTIKHVGTRWRQLLLPMRSIHGLVPLAKEGIVINKLCFEANILHMAI